MAVTIDVPGLGPVSIPNSIPEGQIDSYINKIAEQKGVKLTPPAPPVPTGAAGPVEATIGETKRMLSGMRTGIASLFNPEEAAVEGLKRQQQITERPGYSTEAVSEAYKQGLLPAAGEVVSQVPGAVVSQVPRIGTSLASGWAGAQLAGAAAAPIAPFFGPAAPVVEAGAMALGGLGGMFAPSWLEQFGTNVERQAQEQKEKIDRGEPVQIERGKAATAAAGQAALDVVVDKVVAGRYLTGLLLGKTKEEVAKMGREALEKAVTDAAERGLTKTAVGATAKTAGVEVPTEISQQVLERWQAGLPLTSDDALSEYADAAYGAAISSPLGVPGGILDRHAAKRAIQAKSEMPPPVQPVSNPFGFVEPTDAQQAADTILSNRDKFGTAPLTLQQIGIEDNALGLSAVDNLVQRGDAVINGVESFDVIRDGQIAGSFPNAEEANINAAQVGGQVFERPTIKLLNDEEKVAPTLGPDQSYVYTVPTSRETQPEPTGYEVQVGKEKKKFDTLEEAQDFASTIEPKEAPAAKKISSEIKSLQTDIAKINSALEGAFMREDLTDAELTELNQAAQLDISMRQQRIEQLVQSGTTGVITPRVTPIVPKPVVENGFEVRTYSPQEGARVVTPFATREEAENFVLDFATPDQLKAITDDKSEARASLRERLLKRTESVPATQEPVVKEAPEAVAEETVAPEAVVPEVVAPDATAPEATPEVTETAPVTPPEAAGEAIQEVIEPTPQMQEKVQVVSSRLRGVLDQMGLKNIGVNIQQKLNQSVGGKLSPVDGYYLNRVISASLEGSRDVTSSFGHETIHALRELGMFSDKEWKILSDRAQKDWVAKYQVKERYPELSDDKVIEEAVADAFGDWMGGNLKATGVVQGLFNRIKQTIGQIGSVLTGQGFTTSDQVFQRALKGKLEGKQEVKPEEGAQQARPLRNIYSIPAIKGQWGAPVESNLDNVLYVIQDKMIDTKRVVDEVKKASVNILDRWNPYLQEELYHGRTARQTERFLRTEVRPLLNAMIAANVKTNELEQYLHARHAVERNAAMGWDGASGITDADVNSYLTSLPADRRRTLESLARKVDDLNEETRQLLVSSGLETPATIAAWKSNFKHYVPLFREDVDYGVNSQLGTGRGFDMRGSFSRAAKGSERAVVDILGNVIAQRERAIVRAEKNRVAQALYGLALKAPNPDFFIAVNPDAVKNPAQAINELIGMGLSAADAQNLIQRPQQTTLSRENGVGVKVNGEQRYVIFNRRDPRAARMVAAINNLDADGLGRALNMAGKVTRWFASVNTQYNPLFGVVNFIRDVQGAALNLTNTPLAGEQLQVIADTFPALRGIYASERAQTKSQNTPTGNWAKLWEEFQREGGRTGFREEFSFTNKRGEALQKELDLIMEGKVKKAGRAVFNWLSDYNTTTENAVRLAAYKTALDKGMTKQQAASVAKNLTVNFNRKGQMGSQIGALYAFFNASMQGTMRMAQTLSGKTGRKIMGGGLLLGAMQAMTLAFNGFDEDEPPDFVKERNIVIPIGDGKYITVPMPLGFNVIPNTSRIITEWMLSGGKDTSKRIAQLTGSFIEAFNPIGTAGWSAQTFTPTFADPAVALFENKDWTGKPIAREDFSNLSPTPGYTRAKDTASSFSKELSYFLNYASSGGSGFRKGFISPTPDQLDYLIGQATGGIGREAIKAEQLVTSSITGEKVAPYKIPLAGRFYGDAKASASESNRFYQNLIKMNEHELEMKGRIEAREPTNKYLRENPEARLTAYANRVERQVQQLRRTKRDMIKRGARPEEVGKMEERITNVMKQFNDSVKRYER